MPIKYVLAEPKGGYFVCGNAPFPLRPRDPGARKRPTCCTLTCEQRAGDRTITPPRDTAMRARHEPCFHYAHSGRGGSRRPHLSPGAVSGGAGPCACTATIPE